MYSDGSLQTVEIAGSELQAVGPAVTKGTLRILARVVGPQQSYRAEMYAAVTAIASNDYKQYTDNMAVTKCADNQSKRECSYSNVRHKVCDHTQRKRVIRSSVTIKSSRPVVHMNMSKSSAMGRWTCSPKWPHGYGSKTTIPSVQRI